jgi:hypothetical protein
MRTKLGYDRPMRYWTRLSTLSLFAILAVGAQAQSNGVPPSVTSYGFGGHPGFNGPPASVTSLGHNTGTPRPGPVGIHQPPMRPAPERHHHNQNYAYPYFIPYYPVIDPYAYGGPVEAQPSADPEEQDQYQGGPTIFDRRGSGARAANDYVDDPPAPVAKRAPVPRPPVEVAPDPPDPPASPVASQPNTILVFKDGHKQEVSNYAIVGTNLFDLTPGHRLKISLADLDVPATQKANEDQGVDFTLPALPDGN